jgi:ATP-binding cassette, subfamily C, bacterial CydC
MTRRLRRLLLLVPAPRTRLLQAVVLGALAVTFGVGLMTTAGYLIARAAERPAILSLTVAIVAVRFFGLARPVARYLERLASHDLAFRVLARLRVRFYERIEPLAPAGLEEYRRGDLLSRMVGDVDALQNLYVRGVVPVLAVAVAAAVAVGVALAVLPAAGVVLAAGLCIAAIAVSGLTGRLVSAAGEEKTRAQGRMAAQLVELFRGAPELVVYGRGDEAVERIRDADAVLRRSARRDSIVAGLGDGLTVLVTGVTVALVLATAIGAHRAGTLDRVSIIVLALLAIASFEAVNSFPQIARELSTTLAAGNRILELHDLDPVVRDPARPQSIPHRPAVAFEGVVARYSDAGPEVLAGASFKLAPGRRVALVGRSGAGKTTVVNLLLRFFDPEEGRVTLAGTDIRECRQEDVRAIFAVAGQDAHIFSSTIRENVRLARPAASEQEIERALERARIDRWVRSLPDGIDTMVGEEGTQLSGGQRQRLALARALLADSQVLVLDEPTSQLDAPTASALVRDALAAAGDRSVLLITHRPEGLELVDEVVALDEGRISVVGSS